MLTLAPSQILVTVLFFIVPGFVARAVYALKCPTGKQEWDKVLIELGAYSLFNALLWFPLLGQYFDMPFNEWDRWKFTVNGLLICFVSPFVLALIFVKLRFRFHHWLGIDHPTPRGWDYFLTNSGGEFMVLFHLKGGKKMGGYFGGKSLAATYPHDPELYIQQVWRVDEYGRFTSEVAGSAGAVVRHTDWELIEFFKVEREKPNDSQRIQGRPTSVTCDGGTDRKPELNGRAGGSIPTGTNPGAANGEDNPATGWIGDVPTPEQPPSQPAEAQRVNTGRD